MKKILCLVIAIILMLICVGCSTTLEDESTEHLMFVRVEWEVLNGDTYSVVYHKDTKVMYTVSADTVFTVLLDADGKPWLWEG